MDDTLYALTVRQPWAFAIASGHKRIENRVWLPPLSLLGKTIAIHAGKSCRRADVAALREMAGVEGDHELRRWAGKKASKVFDVRGAVIAVAVLAGVVSEECPKKEWKALDVKPGDPWFSGPYGWVLSDVRVLPESVTCPGKLKLWRLPQEVDAAVRSQVRIRRSR